MRAMLAKQAGNTDVFELTDVPSPQPRPHDLLIEVKASGLNPVDTKIRQGYIPRDLPMILGHDVSGIVRAMGSQATGFKEGDEVYASPNLLRNGANAELVCVDARSAAHKPKTLDHVQAAALPLVTLTAWEALHDRCRMQAGQTVLIHAGGGGVGHIAIQLAKHHGCRVLTTASREESISLCRQLGADEIINYKTHDVVEQVKQLTDDKGCSIVFDTVGGAVFESSLQCVALNGQVVTILGTDSPNIASALFRKNATLHYEFMGVPTIHGVRPERQGEILQQAGELVDNGHLRPHVSQVLPLEQLAEAHQLQETGHTLGKIVVTV